jgi:hypothetical protein
VYDPKGGKATSRMEFAGDFETHWTVAEEQGALLDRVTEAASRRGLKVTYVILSRGAHASQLMLTRRRRSTLSVERADAHALVEGLARDGLRVTRIKLEASSTNDDIPWTDEAARQEPGHYFEHHVKVRYEPKTDLRAITEIAAAHAAHLSQSVAEAPGDGEVQRFITQRCYGVGLPAARTLIAALQSALAEARVHIVRATQEYVVYDTNVALDAGWIEQAARGGVSAR